MKKKNLFFLCENFALISVSCMHCALAYENEKRKKNTLYRSLAHRYRKTNASVAIFQFEVNFVRLLSLISEL